jgi:dephospho-CoA kinase
MAGVIGVTGGAGSGKTTFVKELVRLGARAVDADALARDILDHDGALRLDLKREFGPDLFEADGRLQRRELALRAFSDPLKVQALNQLVWPVLLQRVRSALSELRRKHPDSATVLDMAVLFESGAESLVDKTVVVIAPKKRRIQRLVSERGWSHPEAEMRMRFQMPDAEKRKRADFVVKNDGSLDGLRRHAESVYKKLVLAAS